MRIGVRLTRSWWTRERVLVGLRRFWREQGQAPTATWDYHKVARSSARGPRRRYPSFCAVLQYFLSFREAWMAIGVDVDRVHEDWSEAEDWYVREAAGLVSRVEMARDLRRTPAAIQHRLYDLGLNSYRVHGWSINRLVRDGKLPPWPIQKAVRTGILPVRRGVKVSYVDPADLVELPRLDLGQASDELAAAIRRALLGRLAGALEQIINHREGE